METKGIVCFLRGYAAGLKHSGDEFGSAWINMTADRLDVLSDIDVGDREGVFPNWYERLKNLDYNYHPEKDGEPWYRAADVWVCIEEQDCE